MRQDILRIGQAAFLLAIKEFERIEMYEYCQFAKDQVESYCEYFRIKMWTIEGYQVKNEEHMNLMTELAIIQIETSYKNK